MMTKNQSNEREQLEMLTIDQLDTEDHCYHECKEISNLDMESFLTRTQKAYLLGF